MEKNLNLLLAVVKFQSPSLRGSGRFQDGRVLERHPYADVSIPFIAGQWSLQSTYSSLKPRGPCFNPLHCGAVVASLLRRNAPILPRTNVSIPFIAGQWSLPIPLGFFVGFCTMFQSPSLRGSGRFYTLLVASPPQTSFNPLHCGAVVASYRSFGDYKPTRGSFNPLHCGAVVASTKGGTRCSHCRKCFNPLHCGAVVASSTSAGASAPRRDVSIPFIAGQWSLPDEARDGIRRRLVSIPFIAGQWSLRAGARRREARGSPRFNPLHCGAVVASQRAAGMRCGTTVFQSPSLRGSGRFRRNKMGIPFPLPEFQSPSLRGSGRFRCRSCLLVCSPFLFQSPSLRGSGRFRRAVPLFEGHG